MSVTEKKHHIWVTVLLHDPVTNRKGERVFTSVTNLDLHDIARTSRTYEVDHYFVVTPIQDQHELIARIQKHWGTSRSAEWHPDRFEALSRIQLEYSFEAVKEKLKTLYPDHPLEVMMPDARVIPGQETYIEVRRRLEAEEKEGRFGTKVVVLGTGGGVHPDFFPEVKTFLGPIYGPLGAHGYNHLSVRAAAGIIWDRLKGIS